MHDDREVLMPIENVSLSYKEGRMIEYMWCLIYRGEYGTDVYISENRAVIECKALDIVQSEKGRFEAWAMSDAELVLNWNEYTGGCEQLLMDRAPILKETKPLAEEDRVLIEEAGECIRQAFPFTEEDPYEECCCSCAPSSEDLNEYLRSNL
jgi:hypothetical protein